LTGGSRTKIAALIASRNRENLLCKRSVLSISKQSLQPDLIILVNDGQSFSVKSTKTLERLCQMTDLKILENKQRKGVSAAWNHGIDYLLRNNFMGFIAILDDDDEWDPDHLDLNLRVAETGNANVVISGLRIHGQKRNLITKVTEHDFLVGNPGWQGSNTFIDFSLLVSVGGFTEELDSTNDRDLAIRVMRSTKSRITFTRDWTATWYCDSKDGLSAPHSMKKLSGLRHFWNIYGSEMTISQHGLFFDRAFNLFGLSRTEITEYE